MDKSDIQIDRQPDSIQIVIPTKPKVVSAVLWLGWALFLSSPFLAILFAKNGFLFKESTPHLSENPLSGLWTVL